MGLRIIGGLFKGRILKAPKGTQTRPTTSLVRGAVFNICQDQIVGARFLDLFAGSGAMGFEALSRGALFATFIEQNRHALQSLQENAALLSVESKVQIIGGDVSASLSRLKAPYDIIYLDPPYGRTVEDLLKAIAVLHLLSPRGLLFVEGRGELQISSLGSWTLVESRPYGISTLHKCVLKT
jgi:16S rRNA (guanine966-N2)-methyltransferase